MLLIKLPASRFSTLLGTSTLNERTYADPEILPLGRKLVSISGTQRNKILSALGRQLDEDEWHPNADFSDDGANWLRDGQSIALRSCRLRWEEPQRRWNARFTIGPSLSVDDELILAMYCPDGVRMIRHDGSLGVAETGPRVKAVFGNQINVYGCSGIRGWRNSLELFILPKLQASGCELLGLVPFDHPALTAAAGTVVSSGPERSAAIYEGVPLNQRGSNSRGALLSRLVRAIDMEELHPHAAFEDAPTSFSKWEVESRWRRDGKRVVCRASKLHFEKDVGRWRLSFHGVNVGEKWSGGNDDDESGVELLLAIYCPNGVYVYKHDLQTGLSRTGKAQSVKGSTIKLQGRRGTLDWREALEEEMLPRLDQSAGCERLAFVEWADSIE